MTKEKRLGYLMTIFGACCWALSGACGQFLFDHRGLTTDWLVPVRLTIAGVLLTIYTCVKQRKSLMLFRSVRSIGALLVFSLLGMALCQYSYFRGIELANAATVTTLQYTGPAMVLLWLCMREKRRPTGVETAAVCCAMAGAFLLATHGDPTSLALSEMALFWCMLSAFSNAVYSVQPRELIRQYGTLPVTGFGMLISGSLLSIAKQPWHIVGEWDGVTFAALAFVVFFGTICAFCCFLEGVRRIGAAKGSVLASVEPVVSAILSVFWLKVPLEKMDFAGVALIVAAMVLMGCDDSGSVSAGAGRGFKRFIRSFKKAGS